jgi:cyanoexosortase A
MKATYLASVRICKSSQFWLLGTAASLVAIHLTLAWRSGEIDHLGMSVLFWLAVSYLLWQKHNSLNLRSGVFSKVLGILIIAWVLLNSVSPKGSFFYLSPFISTLGLGLLSSGFKGLKQYRQELIILFFLGLPRALLSSLVDISPFTAKFSAFLLWYLGFEVTRQGVHIALPTGGVEVHANCSGLGAMTYMLGLAVLFIVLFPTERVKEILVLIVSVSLAFVVNGVRVALMAVLSASSNKQAFNYWHIGNGSMIFAMISVSIFGLFCLLMLRLYEPESEDSIEG